MKALCFVLISVAAACGGGGGAMGGDDGNATADAHVFMDAPPVVPTSLTVSGKVTEQNISGTSAVSGVKVALYANGDDAHTLATAMSDAQGNFTMTLMTSGQVVDGYLLATKASYIDIYLYPSAPLTKDFTAADINMLTPSNRDFLSNLASGNQMSGKGMIGLAVLDANGQPVAGATVSSTPAASAYRYTGSNGYPSGSATSTSADGVAFMFNMPTGPITVTAAKAGMTFKSHVVKAPADKFTTTAVEP